MRTYIGIGSYVMKTNENQQKTSAMAFFVLLFGALIAGASAVVLPPAGVLVCGPGSREVSLIAAKLASAAGYASTAIVADGSQFSSRLLLYGKAYAAAEADDPTRAQLAVSGDEIGAALNTAQALIVVAHEQPMEPSQVSLIVQNAPALERAVLLCRCGVTRAEAGLFGIKGPDVALRETEENWRRAADENGFELALVRAGGLKGGGAGLKPPTSTQPAPSLRPPWPYPASTLHPHCTHPTTTPDTHPTPTLRPPYPQPKPSAEGPPPPW